LPHTPIPSRNRQPNLNPKLNPLSKPQPQGLPVAIKKQRSSDHRKTSEAALRGITQAVRREVRALARVRHPNVVRLYGACIEQPPCLVMAFAAGGALDDAVREGRFASNAAVVTLLAGIARGMEAVHAHKIIHLDLKPENILLSAENVPWVTDFGLSTSSNLTSMSTSSVGGRGTIYYKVSSAPRSPHPPAPGRLHI
jgi:serine/threonine protein kinase